MAMLWKVSYRLAAPLAVTTSVGGYPSLGLRFVYDGDDKLSWVEHVFETDVPEEDIYAESDRRLRFLWEYLHFRSGLPVVKAQETRELVEQPSDRPRRRSGRIVLSAGAEVVLPVEWVAENALGRLVREPLTTLWLHFANEAKMTKSNAEAIRLYFLIWEDWRAQRTAPDDDRGERLEFTRHFLSHARIDKSKGLAFLAEHLGAGTDRYDPSNPHHETFVQRMRKDAFDLIRSELSRRIGALERFPAGGPEVSDEVR
jgi:hypothetical protein